MIFSYVHNCSYLCSWIGAEDQPAAILMFTRAPFFHQVHPEVKWVDQTCSRCLPMLHECVATQCWSSLHLFSFMNVLGLTIAWNMDLIWSLIAYIPSLRLNVMFISHHYISYIYVFLMVIYHNYIYIYISSIYIRSWSPIDQQSIYWLSYNIMIYYDHIISNEHIVIPFRLLVDEITRPFSTLDGWWGQLVDG
jgi:hypothetical protein